MEIYKILLIFRLISLVTANIMNDLLSDQTEDAVQPIFRRLLKDKSEVILGAVDTNIPVFGKPIHHKYKMITNPFLTENDSRKQDIVKGMIVKEKDGIMRLMNAKNM